MKKIRRKNIKLFIDEICKYLELRECTKLEETEAFIKFNIDTLVGMLIFTVSKECGTYSITWKHLVKDNPMSGCIQLSPFLSADYAIIKAKFFLEEMLQNKDQLKLHFCNHDTVN